MENTALIMLMILMVIMVIMMIIIVAMLFGMKRSDGSDHVMDEFSRTRREINEQFRSISETMGRQIRDSAEAQDRRLAELNTRFSSMAVENEQKLDNIRNTMESRIKAMTADNNVQLEKMRETVDEKLQSTLEERISRSFKLVSERLEEVYKGLGEMQNLAAGVGDLKKVLSNVKTRGILGEVQLSAILEQILTRDQYDENVATKKGSTDRVEFAVRLPGDGDSLVYLPIDAKFPLDKYSRLLDSYDTGDKTAIAQAKKELRDSIKNSAKYIRDKYIDPPNTTDFGIHFLPVEGLYAEVVRDGMIEELQRDYKINIAGPTTMAALLNSLQMGFRTLAIEKHSSQVWEVLGAVKTEFDKFEASLRKAQEKINSANSELDNLIGRRTNVMKRKLRDVEALPEDESGGILGISGEGDI